MTRLASGGFTQEQAVTIEEVSIAMENGSIADLLLPIEYGVADFAHVAIDQELWRKVRNGMRLSYQDLGLTDRPDQLIAIFYQDQLVSIYKAHDKYHDIVKPAKVIRTEIGE